MLETLRVAAHYLGDAGGGGSQKPVEVVGHLQ